MAEENGQVEDVDSAIVVEVGGGVGGAPGAEQDGEVEDVDLAVVVQVANFP